MHSLIAYVFIGAGGPRADILAAIWLVFCILALFLISRSTRIRVARRLVAGVQPARAGDPSLRKSLNLGIWRRLAKTVKRKVE
jgi:hypothetical protein